MTLVEITSEIAESQCLYLCRAISPGK